MGTLAASRGSAEHSSGIRHSWLITHDKTAPGACGKVVSWGRIERSAAREGFRELRSACVASPPSPTAARGIRGRITRGRARDVVAYASFGCANRGRAFYHL